MPRRLVPLATSITVAAALVAAMLAAAGPASADPAEAGRRLRATLVCGQVPTTDVVLRADLTCPTGFHFFPGDAPVTIDLRGHTLTVPGDAGACTAPGPCGAVAGAAAVRNGTVVGTLSDIGDISSVVVHGDVEVGLGFAGAGGPAAVRGSLVLDGRVRVWGPSVTLTGNIIRGGIAVVSTSRAVRDLVITGNWVLQSPHAGISVAPPQGNFPDDVTGTISRNIVWGATGAGIDIGGGIWNVGALTVEQNLFLANGGGGFRSGTTATGPPTAFGGPVTLRANVSMFNAGRGFDAGWMAGLTGTGVVDGGANRSVFDDGTPPCVGVTC